MLFSKSITENQYKKKLLKNYKWSVKENREESINFFEFLLKLHEIEIK